MDHTQFECQSHMKLKPFLLFAGKQFLPLILDHNHRSFVN